MKCSFRSFIFTQRPVNRTKIADRLHISPRTVTTHLSNAYERLGLSGRAALARYVVQRGLVPDDGGEAP